MRNTDSGTRPRWSPASRRSARQAQPPVVRVPVGDFGAVSRVLDFGAEAVIAPMINTAADARAFAAAAKFPPVGERSWGPHRATMLAGIADQKDYLRDANDADAGLRDDRDTRCAAPMSMRSRERTGIDALFLGPADLSIALATARTLDPMGKDDRRRRSTACSPLRTGPESSSAPSARRRRAPSTWRNAACSFSPSRATSPSCAPERDGHHPAQARLERGAPREVLDTAAEPARHRPRTAPVPAYASSSRR